MAVKLSELELAVEFVSFDSYSDESAYLDIGSGEIFYDGDGVDEELPADIFDSNKYCAIPSKHDLDLGKPLVIEFVASHFPDDLNTVDGFFSARGAYARYKSLLERRNCLEKWYQYQQQALIEALTDWCDDQGIKYQQSKLAVIANTPNPPYYAVIFTSLLTDNDEGYAEASERMVELAASQSGFLGIESARQEVGITVSYWRDLASIKSWKANVEHLQAQLHGRKKWYGEFKVRISKVERDYGI